jgi:hypothetical protein
MGLCGVRRRRGFATQQVLLLRHRFQVCRVHTRTLPADVVKDESIDEFVPSKLE